MFTTAEFTALAQAAQHDPQALIERLCWITTKQLPGQPPLTKLVFNKAQQRIHQAIMQQRDAGDPPRMIVLKARQPGISTQACGYIAAALLTSPYAHAIQVAQEETATTGLFKKVRFMIDRFPEGLQPKLWLDRRNEFGLDTLELLDGAVQLRTRLVCATAGTGTSEPWRSMTAKVAHISEFAKFPNPEEVLLGIMQAVPRTPDSLVILESTAMGMGNCFNREWDRAVAGESGFTPIFIPWFDLPENTRPVPADFELEPEEADLKRAFGLSNEQMQWRRYAIFTDCLGDSERFAQEHPATAAEAFLTSGLPALPRKPLQELMELAMREGKPTRGIMTEQGFVKLQGGPLAIKKFPVKGHDYVVSGDPSAGVEGGDPSCIQVFDRDTGEQVAWWHGYMNPIPFADLMVRLGVWFNTAILAPEVNNHGLSVIGQIKFLQYPRMYQWQRVDRIKGTVSNFLGWLTSMATRPLMIDSMGWALKEAEVKLWDPETIREGLEFQWVNDIRAEGMKHDDRIMAFMIAYRVHLESPLLATGQPPKLKFADEPKPEVLPDHLRPYERQAWDETDEALKAMAKGKAGPTLEDCFPCDGEALPAADMTPDGPW